MNLMTDIYFTSSPIRSFPFHTKHEETKMKQKHFIDSHKALTFVFILGFMWFYNLWENTTAWVYLATHGTYGILWLIKSASFGDKSWERPCGIGYGIFIWAGLSLYLVNPWLIGSRGIEAPVWLLGLVIFLVVLGVFFHFASDMQKDITLKLKPGLITEGLWSRCRNPNYFGELLIYGGFSLLAMHWLPFVVLGLFLLVVWIPNMRKKDKSLSRYPEFAAYKKRSGLLIPYLL